MINIIINNNMGIQSKDYPFSIKTATIAFPKNIGQFTDELNSTLDANCDIFIAPIFNTEDIIRQNALDLDTSFLPSDQTFSKKDLPHICPLINPELVFGEAINRKQKLKFFVDYCGYLCLRCVSIDFNQKFAQQQANSLNFISKSLCKSKLSIILNIIINQKDVEANENLWLEYYKFRKNLDNRIIIDINLQMEVQLANQSIIKRWMAQKLTFVTLSKSIFVLNNKGFPVLPAIYQKLVKQWIKMHSNLILRYQNSLNADQKDLYFKYLAFLFEKTCKALTQRQTEAKKLQDYLQDPLQPYIDNLQSETYAIFQFDAPKYNEYQLALISALQTFPLDKKIIVYYIGTGRGMILSKIFSACKATKRKVFVYLIEKNPFPIQTLKRRIKKNKWDKFVKVVQTDIKTYQMPQKPDIFVSELLGGFGDNQLSPECLQWAQKNITKDTICIPTNYSSYIKPVSYPSVHRKLNNQQKESYFTINYGWHYAPFKSQKVWTFTHPLKEQSLQKFAKVNFPINQNITLHGLYGTFDSLLYGNGFLSIVPQEKTHDMYSWFPLYFAFFEQEFMQKGQNLTVQINRRCTNQKVWYEWKYSIYDANQIKKKQSKWHNYKGDLAVYLVE